MTLAKRAEFRRYAIVGRMTGSPGGLFGYTPGSAGSALGATVMADVNRTSSLAGVLVRGSSFLVRDKVNSKPSTSWTISLRRQRESQNNEQTEHYKCHGNELHRRELRYPRNPAEAHR